MSSEAASPAIVAVAEGSKNDNSMLPLIVGVIGLILAAVGLAQGWSQGEERPFLGYLIGFGFWTSIAIGMLMLTMIFWIFDAGWSVVIRRQLEHGIGVFKYLLVLFLPLAATVFHEDSGLLWGWLNPDKLIEGGQHQLTVGTDVLYAIKSPLLNLKGFFIISFGAFLVWIFFAEKLRAHSFTMDSTGDPKHVHAQRKLAAAGIICTALTLTFASILWFKSLEYHWFSTMYGVWFFASCIWSSLAMTVIVMHLLNKTERLRNVFSKAHFYLVGCLMLAFTVFWAYISFSQYFLIYNANIPEETFWYHIRGVGGLEMMDQPWWWVAMGLIFGHFFVPFLVLLWYRAKRAPFLFYFAFYVLTMHVVDLYWNILPGRIPADNELGYVVRGLGLHLTDIGAFIGIGGICIWAFVKSTSTAAAIPLRDPRVKESIHCHE